MKQLRPRRSVFFFIAFLFTVIIYYSCKKSEQPAPEPVNAGNNTFFTVPANTNPIVTGIINAFNRENEKYPFAETMIKNAGHPQWAAAKIKSRSQLRQSDDDVTINIPLLQKGAQQTTAILVANIQGTDTACQLVYPQDYLQYQMSRDTMQNQQSAVDLFNVFANFDYELFGTTQYIINDGRIFGWDQEDTLIATVDHPDSSSFLNGKVDLTNADVATICNAITTCRPVSQKRSIQNGLVAPDCTTSYDCTVITTGTTAGGGGTLGGSGIAGGGSSGSGSTGGSSGVGTLTQAPCARNARLPNLCGAVPWTPVSLETTAMEQETGLTDNDPNLIWWNDTTRDPNTNYIQQARPKYDLVYSNYPKTADATNDMPVADVCKLIGGEILADYNHIDPTTGKHGIENACAIRVSRALNYSGVAIPKIDKQTHTGADGKNYFYMANQLLNWIGKTFGPADLHYTAEDGAPNGTKFSQLLGGIQNRGIYIMKPKSQQAFRATGHASLWGGLNCIGGHNYFPAASDVYVWKLPQ